MNLADLLYKIGHFMSTDGMDSSFFTKILEYMPFLALLGGLGRWIFQLKTQVESAHRRLDDLEDRQTRFEDKIDAALLEINRRIDDCKDSILKSVNTVLQAVSKN